MAALFQDIVGRREIKVGDFVGIINMKIGSKGLYRIRDITNGKITINPLGNENITHIIEYDDTIKDYKIMGDDTPYQFNFINGDIGLPGDVNLYDMLVFDFDCTVTKFHTCGKNALNEQQANLPNALDNYVGLENSLRFKLLIENAKKLGMRVAIASYGRKNVILALMNQIFGIVDNPFSVENIITPADIAEKFGIKWDECRKNPPMYNKNSMLDILSERYNIPKEEILLVDDTEGNVETALESDYGGIAVSKCKGFDAVLSDLNKVIKSLPGL